MLVARFPLAFSQKRRRPLKLGIREDLAAALGGAITRTALRDVLRWYTASGHYQRTCVEGAVRVDLDGKPAGTVSADEVAARQRSKHELIAKLLIKRRPKHQAAPRSRIVGTATISDPPPRKIDTDLSAPRRLSLADLREAARARREGNDTITKQQREGLGVASPAAEAIKDVEGHDHRSDDADCAS